MSSIRIPPYIPRVAFFTRKGDISVADIEELKKMDACEIHAGRLNAKEVFNAPKMVTLYFPDRRWNGQTIWTRSGSENIHLNSGSPRWAPLLVNGTQWLVKKTDERTVPEAQRAWRSDLGLVETFLDVLVPAS